MLTDVACTHTSRKSSQFYFFLFLPGYASKSPHSALLTLPTAPCALLATTLRAPHLASHYHSPTSPYLPLSPGTWLRTAPRRTSPGKPYLFFLLFCLLRCGQTVFVFALQEHQYTPFPPLPTPLGVWAVGLKFSVCKSRCVPDHRVILSW